MPDEDHQGRAPRHATRSDEEIGRALAAAARVLNEAIIEACQAKLEVEISVIDQAEPGGSWKSVSLHAWRKIAIV